MKMKQLIVTIAAATMAFTATAQSLEEGMKMYRYERYASAKKILQPLAATDAMANYYYGLAELELGNADAAMNAFVKYPEDYANISGTVRVKFAVEGEAAGMQAAQALGRPASTVFKTLIVALDSGELVCAIVASDARLNLKAIASAAPHRR